MLFATLILGHEPLQWHEVPQAVVYWLQSAGTIAAVGLFLVYAVQASFSFERMFAPGGRPSSPRLAKIGTFCTIASWVGFAVVAMMFVLAILGVRDIQPQLPGMSFSGFTIGDIVYAAAGILSLSVVLYPVLRAIFADMRPGRIWAVARLSIKQTNRDGTVAIFGVIALIFLFASWFIKYDKFKPEDQVRNYVWVLYWAMTVLFLLSAGILGSFSLPTDIKNQTIHTVVTKPITKFEIVLGRFLGFGILLTVSLFLVGSLSLVYIARGVTAEAGKESFVARVPVYGRLGFINTEGDSVGREWGYRKYISGTATAPGKKQYAGWYFFDLSEIRPRDDGKVRIEFGFDIFRLTKGQENKGINVTFKFAPGKNSVKDVEAMIEQRRREFDKRKNEAIKQGGDLNAINPKIEADLLKDFPVYEMPGEEVTDYHTQSIDVPYAFIERMREIDKDNLPAADGRRTAAMQIFVSIDTDRASSAQMLGVAQRDLFILAAERGFYANFLKGLVGLWFGTLLVLGIAICCSTYLSGVISLLCTMFLLMAGYFTPSIEQIANNQSVGGGPAEAFSRIVNRNNMVAPLDDTATTTVIKGVDEISRWLLRRVLTLIPDASRYDLHPYVANGFDVSPTTVLFADNFLPLIGYLIPWFVLAFYLINYREIANPM